MFVDLIPLAIVLLPVVSAVFQWLPYAPELMNSTDFSLIENGTTTGNACPEMREPYLIEVALPTYRISCNDTMKRELVRGNTPSPDASTISCEQPDPLGIPRCNNDNTISMVFCYDSLFDSKNRFVRRQFQIKNVNNNVTKLCNNGVNSVRTKHGIGVGLCVEKALGQHIIHMHVQLSYSEKSYKMPKVKLSTKARPGQPKSPAQAGFVKSNGQKSELAPVFSFLFGKPNDDQLLPITHLIDHTGNIVNANESIINDNKWPINRVQQINNTNTVGKNLLVFAFVDMLSYSEADKTFRNLTFNYVDAYSFKTELKINGMPIELNGNSRLRKNLKKLENKCEKRYPDDCALLRHYKELICQELLKCFLSSSSNPPPEILNRWQIPEWLRNSLNISSTETIMTEEMELQRFNRHYRCNNPDDFSLGDDYRQLKPDNMEQRLEEAKDCNKRNTGNGTMKRRRRRRIRREIHRPEKRWDSPIEYKFDEGFENDHPDTYRAIEKGIKHIEDETCIRFVENANPTAEHYMLFYNSGECESKGGIGRDEDREHKITINTEWFGTAVHEIGHALGLYHEFQRLDRDEYIWLELNSPKLGESYNLTFDFSSAMQYQPSFYYDRFSRNWVYDTISFQRAYQDSIGPDVDSGFSFKDAKLVNQFYCTETCKNSSPLQCQNAGYQDPNNCDKCRCPVGFTGKLCTELASSDGRICSSNLGTFDISPTKSGTSKLIGKMTGIGNCFWRIKSLIPGANPVRLTEIVIKEINGMKCPSKHEDCGSYTWIFPCNSYLRIQYQKDKSESGARLCCQYSLPLVLTSKSMMPSSGFGDVILELKNNEEIEVSFMVEFSTEFTLKNSCGCGDPMDLFKDNRNPGTTRNTNVTSIPLCKLGEQNAELQCLIPIGKKAIIKVNAIKVTENEIVHSVSDPGEGYAISGIIIRCLTSIHNDNAPFWAWIRDDKESIRIDEYQCY